MANLNRRQYVVLMNQGAKGQIGELISELRQIAGVEVSAESKSSVDILTDEDVVQKDLENIIRRMDAELHPLPVAQLMDPIPPKKIP